MFNTSMDVQLEEHPTPKENDQPTTETDDQTETATSGEKVGLKLQTLVSSGNSQLTFIFRKLPFFSKWLPCIEN